jgi:hypothetical protein
MQRVLMGYGVNIDDKHSMFDRVATFEITQERTAISLYYLLEQSLEVQGGCKIDLEEIYETGNGFEYRKILKNYTED